VLLFLIVILLLGILIGVGQHMQGRKTEIAIRAKIAEARRDGRVDSDKSDDELIHESLQKQQAFGMGLFKRQAIALGVLLGGMIFMLIGFSKESNSIGGSTIGLLMILIGMGIGIYGFVRLALVLRVRFRAESGTGISISDIRPRGSPGGARALG
jgi:hypothetical protein